MRFDDNEWKESYLGQVCSKFDYGIGAEAIDFDGRNRYIRITDIDEDNSHYIRKSEVSPSYIDENCVVQENDILFARTGASTGKTYLYSEQDGKLYFAGFLVRANVKKEFSSYFIYQQTKINRYKKWIQIMSARSGQPGVNAKEYQKYKVYYPNIQIQNKIADFFTFLNQRIDTQNKIIEDLKLFKNSIMDDLLTKKYFIEMSLSDFVSKGYARIIKSSELTKFNGEKSYLSTSSIDSNGIVNIECKITYYNRPSRASMMPIKNSVWFAKMKDTIKVYKSENDDESKYVLSTGFYGILCDENKVSSDWILEIFKSNYFNNQKNRFSEGSSMSGIKDNQLEDIQVKIFSNKNEEIKFCKLFKLLNRKLKSEQLLLEKLKEQKKYLLSNMFI